MNKKRRRVYLEPKAGEWVSPIRKGYRLRCCDCALIHRMDFGIEKRAQGGVFVRFRVWRDNRATAAARRKKRTK